MCRCVTVGCPKSKNEVPYHMCRCVTVGCPKSENEVPNHMCRCVTVRCPKSKESGFLITCVDVLLLLAVQNLMNQGS